MVYMKPHLKARADHPCEGCAAAWPASPDAWEWGAPPLASEAAGKGHCGERL